MPIMSRSVNIFVLGWKKMCNFLSCRRIGPCTPEWVANQRTPFSSFSFLASQCPHLLSIKRHSRYPRQVKCDGRYRGKGGRNRKQHKGEKGFSDPLRTLKVKLTYSTRASNTVALSLDAPLHDGGKRPQSDAREPLWGGREGCDVMVAMNMYLNI